MTRTDLSHKISKVLAVMLIIVLFAGLGQHWTKAFNQNPTVVFGKSVNESVLWPIPDSLVGGIPVYYKFESIEPLLRFENDTTYVINFWATWCKPCIEELPIFEMLHSIVKNEKIRVVMVSLDFAEQLENKLVPFILKQELKSTVLVLLDGKYHEWINNVSPDWSGAIPATYIYKQDQKRLIESRFETLEELTETINSFL